LDAITAILTIIDLGQGMLTNFCCCVSMRLLFDSFSQGDLTILVGADVVYFV